MSGKTSTKTESAAGAARLELKAVEQALATAEAELRSLESEHQALEEDITSGSLLVDAERFDELEEVILPRKRRRVADLRERILPLAQQTLASIELFDLARDAEAGIGHAYETFTAKRSAAELKIAQGAQELKEAGQAWNFEVQDYMSKASGAGLVEGKADPLAYVQMGTAQEYMFSSDRQKPDGVKVGGVHYWPVDEDALVLSAVQDSSETLARYVASGEQGDYLAQYRNLK